VALLLEDIRTDPNSLDAFRQGPLLWAARYGHIEIVKLLLARNDVRPNIEDTIGNIPLSRASEHGHTSVGITLLKSKASHYGHTESLWAADNYFFWAVEPLLADFDVDWEARDANGCTPLLLAARNCSTQLIEVCLRHGAKITAR
jgi:hypothetical protein